MRLRLPVSLRLPARPFAVRRNRGTNGENRNVTHPFWVIVQKEIADHVNSWRFLILLALMVLTCIGSLYAALSTIRSAVAEIGSNRNIAVGLEDAFVFLKLFTLSNDTLPSFVTFVSFLGPLIGIGMGFDAINSERNKGTLGRVMAQPIHRDSLLNAKFVAALIVVSVMFFGLGFLVMGMGLITIGIPPTPEEFWRMLAFLVLTVFYIAFWLNLSILFSVWLRQAATSALAGIAVWLFFSIFFGLIVGLVADALAPSQEAGTETVLQYVRGIQLLQRLSPSYLYSEATATILDPSVRALGPLTVEQTVGTIPSLLPLGQSLLLVWPQVTGLVAATLLCFAAGYAMFMRQEIRSRS